MLADVTLAAAAVEKNAPRFDWNGIREEIYPFGTSTRSETAKRREAVTATAQASKQRTEALRTIHSNFGHKPPQNKSAHQLFRCLLMNDHERGLLDLADDTSVLDPEEDPSSLTLKPGYDPNREQEKRQRKLDMELLRGGGNERAWASRTPGPPENFSATERSGGRNLSALKMRNWLKSRYGQQQVRQLSVIPECTVRSVAEVRNGAILHTTSLSDVMAETEWQNKRSRLLETVGTYGQDTVYATRSDRREKRSPLSDARVIDRIDVDGRCSFRNPLDDPYLNALDEYYDHKDTHLRNRKLPASQARDNLARKVENEDFEVHLLGCPPYRNAGDIGGKHRKNVAHSPTRTAYHLRRHQAERFLQNERIEEKRVEGERQREREKLYGARAGALRNTRPSGDKGRSSPSKALDEGSPVAGQPRYPMMKGQMSIRAANSSGVSGLSPADKKRKAQAAPKNYQYESSVAKVARSMGAEKQSDKSLGDRLATRKANPFLSAVKEEMMAEQETKSRMKCSFLGGIHSGYRSVLVNKTLLDPFAPEGLFGPTAA